MDRYMTYLFEVEYDVDSTITTSDFFLKNYGENQKSQKICIR